VINQLKKGRMMKFFKKRVYVRSIPTYEDWLNPTKQTGIKHIYRRVWDMRKIGIFAGVFAVVAGLLATVAFMGFRGGNPATAVPQDTTTTTVVESTTTTSTTVPVDEVMNVCDMPRSYSTEYDLGLYESRKFNATMWKEQGITLVFEWALPDEYDRYMFDFIKAVDKFSKYTGLKTEVMKGYDETAANILDYEWDYLMSMEDPDNVFSQERLTRFLEKYDPKKLSINVVLDDTLDDGTLAWVMGRKLRFGLVKSYLDQIVGSINGGEVYAWDQNYMHVVLHELGHIVGLGHTHISDDDIRQDNSIMSYEALTTDQYLPGDIAGLQEIFCKEEK